MRWSFSARTLCYLHAGVLSSCPGSSCSISPASVNVSEDRPAVIVCTIPNLSGSTAGFINQLRHDIPNGSSIPDLHNYANVTAYTDSSAEYFTYHLTISWTDDSKVREQLSVIQCVANFQCPQILTSSPPCFTPSVTVNFVEREPEEGMWLFRNLSVRVLW